MSTKLEKAQQLYNDKEWEESVKLLAGFKSDDAEEMAEAARLNGWNLYYLAINGPEEAKIDTLEGSKEWFICALEKTADDKKKVSALSGLPLALWILDEGEEAWRVNNQAIADFPDEPSIWNTRSILYRWSGYFELAANICERTYASALKQGDLRMAGHAKHNRGDDLNKLGRHKEAKDEYAAAIGLYKDYQRRTGHSAQFHIEAVDKKLKKLFGLD